MWKHKRETERDRKTACDACLSGHSSLWGVVRSMSWSQGMHVNVTVHILSLPLEEKVIISIHQHTPTHNNMPLRVSERWGQRMSWFKCHTHMCTNVFSYTHSHLHKHKMTHRRLIQLMTIALITLLMWTELQHLIFSDFCGTFCQ